MSTIRPFVSVHGNKKNNAQCEQFFKNERIAKLIRRTEKPYQEALIKVDRDGPNGPPPSE